MAIQGLLNAQNHIQAITPRDPEELVAELQSAWGLSKVHKTARNFIESTAAVSLIKGPFRVRGMGSIELEKGDEGAPPALAVGSAQGCDFWLMLDSGKVTTSPSSEVAPEIDVELLIALQTSLFAAFGETDPPRGPRFLRVVAECFGSLGKLQRALGQGAVSQLLGEVDPTMLADMVSAEKRWARVLKQDPAQVKVIDWRFARLLELPILDDFVALEAIDLRGNSELEPEQVMEVLAPLQKLHRLDVSRCEWPATAVEALRQALPACRVVDEVPRGEAEILAAARGSAALSRVDLSRLDLRTLPASLAEVEGLEELDLSHNPRLDWPTVFTKLAGHERLRRVDLLGCRLRKLPEEITGLSALEEIDLTCGTWGDHNCLNVSETLSLLSQLPNLRRLTLDGARLFPGQWRTTMRSLSERFSNLKHVGMAGWTTIENSGRMFAPDMQKMLVKMGQVESVNLGGLEITALEPSLVELPLKRLDISKNNITAVAPAQLEHLEELIARGTSLASLEGLERCRKLRSLDVVGPRGAQRAFAFPDWLDWLSELRTLRVENLAFAEVPAAIGTLSKLEELALSSKTLANLPAEIGQLEQLRSLRLSDLVGGCEQLTELPHAVGNLGALSALIVNHGGLRALPESISDCKALREVELDDVKLADPNETVMQLAQLPALERLSIANSGLTRVSEALADCETLKDVRILGDFSSFAQAARVICSLPNLERLDLTRFALASLPACFSECANLRALHYETPRGPTALSSEVLFSALARLPRFVELSIDDIAGHWRELPSSIGDLSRLEKLTLSSVTFKQLPKRMARLHNLRVLHLDRCPNLRGGALKRMRRALPDCEILITDW